jgi:hypothetical protein
VAKILKTKFPGENMKKFLLYLLPVLALICSDSGFAQTVLNQSNVTSPYQINTPGSYILTSNLTTTVAGQNAIVINVPNVTLNLNGYTISGPDVCTSAGCSSATGNVGVLAETTNTVVENGNISGFGYGVYIESGQVENVGISSCAIGVFAMQATVHHNQISKISDWGIYALNSTVSENQVAAAGNGIYGSFSSIVSNSSYENTTYGALLAGGFATGNTFGGNGTDLDLINNAVTTKNNACTSGAC